jgi:hypothetical protein
MRNSKEDIMYMQSLPGDPGRDIIFHTRAYLLFTSILCAFLCGTLSSSTKFLTETVGNAENSKELFADPFFYLFGTVAMTA